MSAGGAVGRMRARRRLPYCLASPPSLRRSVSRLLALRPSALASLRSLLIHAYLFSTGAMTPMDVVKTKIQLEPETYNKVGFLPRERARVFFGLSTVCPEAPNPPLTADFAFSLAPLSFALLRVSSPPSGPSSPGTVLRPSLPVSAPPSYVSPLSLALFVAVPCR